ncbi:MAG: hypothetical protein R3C69_13840 [Geminicoccaceae bacterium]
MLRYVLHRLIVMIPTVIAISVVTFVIIQLPPGDFLSAQISELQAQGEGPDRAHRVSARALRLERPLCSNISSGPGGSCTAISAGPSSMTGR